MAKTKETNKMERYKTIEKANLIDAGYKYMIMYGGSELWANNEHGLLLDKLKENDEVYEIRFKYQRGKET